DELVRVFENLVENALKYAASGKRVDIVLSCGEGLDGKAEALVAVRDRGPGIAPEHLPRLTERFYRVDVSESRAQGGTGLGLALGKPILNPPGRPAEDGDGVREGGDIPRPSAHRRGRGRGRFVSIYRRLRRAAVARRRASEGKYRKRRVDRR